MEDKIKVNPSLYKLCIFNYTVMQTLNISLPRALVSEADSLAKKQASSRSELIHESLRAYIVRAKILDTSFKVGSRKAKKLGLKNEDEVFDFLKR